MAERLRGARHPLGAPASAAARSPAEDPAEAVALVAHARRDVLLRAYRGRLREEDLEDCFSQATVELIQRARRDRAFRDRAHIANALEQKLCSRIHDRRRALSGRSAMEAALEGALVLGQPCHGCVEPADAGAPVDQVLADRESLRRLLAGAAMLSADQRLALACEVGLCMGAEEFCARFGWSREKLRKVLQRGRARLRTLTAEVAC